MDFNGRMTLDKVLYLSFSQKIPLCIDIKSLFSYIDKKLQKRRFFVPKYRHGDKNFCISMHNYNFASIWQILNSHIDIWGKFSVQNGEKYRYTKNRFLYRYFPSSCPSGKGNPSLYRARSLPIYISYYISLQQFPQLNFCAGCAIFATKILAKNPQKNALYQPPKRI